MLASAFHAFFRKSSSLARGAKVVLFGVGNIGSPERMEFNVRTNPHHTRAHGLFEL